MVFPSAAASTSSSSPQSQLLQQQSPQPQPQSPLAGPVLGSFADVWAERQASDIVFDTDVDTKGKQQPAVCECTHLMRVTRHNPYSLLAPLTHVFVCECADCMATAGHTPSNSNSNRSSNHRATANAAAAATAELCAEEEEEEHHTTTTTTTTTATEETPMFLSAFMPPPPPRMDTHDVLVACGAEDADSVVYAMMVRWYTRVAAVERYFVATSEELCPEPAPDAYDFREWCERANAWWFARFEHCQKKPHPPMQQQQQQNGSSSHRHAQPW